MKDSFLRNLLTIKMHMNKIETQKLTQIEKSNKFESIGVHGENFMAIFTTLSVVVCFSTGTLVIFATLVYVFTMCVVIKDILSMAIIPTLSISTTFCNLCYILL